jgi:hypothetical protein
MRGVLDRTHSHYNIGDVATGCVLYFGPRYL